MTYTTGRQNTALIDRLHREDREHEVQLADEERRRRERNEDIYAQAIRSFWRKTDR